MLDRCPHRAAALSEGRMTASGDLQCAYHGMVLTACPHPQSIRHSAECWMLLVQRFQVHMTLANVHKHHAAMVSSACKNLQPYLAAAMQAGHSTGRQATAQTFPRCRMAAPSQGAPAPQRSPVWSGRASCGSTPPLGLRIHPQTPLLVGANYNLHDLQGV